MKIYTKTGDKGKTSLFGGSRVPKHHLRLDCYGTLDELNSWLGLIRDQPETKGFNDILLKIQGHLFSFGAILATEPSKTDRLTVKGVEGVDAAFLEDAMDRMDAQLKPLTQFILPGGHTVVSYIHIARTVCRRAERNISLLHENEPLPESLLIYINRLSDYLFVLARILLRQEQLSEVTWTPKNQ